MRPIESGAPPGKTVGVVLAGGESRRMGRDKALLRLDGGITLLERTVAALRAAGLETVALSVASAERGAALQEAVPAVAGLPLVPDATAPGCGPLAGLHAALHAFPGHDVLLVACDMPRLAATALRALLGEPRDADAVVPRSQGRDQPLHALYGPACLPVVARLIEQGRLAMRDLLGAPDLRVRVLDETWLAHHGIPATTFDNLNTPEDLAPFVAAQLPLLIAERDGERPCVADEDDLCRLWAAPGSLPSAALVTTDGERLQVVYPGRRSGAGGPDFRGAILADAAGRMRSGDVEVHLRSRDWVAHGHRADPTYNEVVLHVVVEDDGAACLRADGRPVPVLALGAWVRAPLATLAADAATVAVDAQPCRVSPALLTQDVRAIVRAAGRTRLEAKAAALEAQLVTAGPEQALFGALLDAAGYSRNRAPCALLAQRLPVERLYSLLAGKPPERAADIASAVLLGLAGLLRPGPDDNLPAVWATYAELWPLPPLHADQWVRAGVRPANRPELRLRGIATLLARHARDGLAEALLAPLRTGDAAALLARLEVPAPAASTDAGHSPLIGRGRAVEMAANVVAPFALALARSEGDAALEGGAWRTVEALPGGEDSDPLRYMRALLAGSGHRLHAPGALEQQGLLHLYRTYCSAHACWDCPLAGH